VVVTALYRRYRPETFSELIGQSQVTEPLMTALRTNRVNHAYLFSGPRGCGKTTSARILARCLNCVEGPTDSPCGKCPSCVELSRDGGGSLDVVEIDAASHNGVDDARDLRERAVFAPARDRYKIFILDEAHMVTPQGFNALLKIVEEPPEHVKFVFATTEPEKVIGTIRSRTHHYPFRLVPPAQMLEYVQELCESEKVTVAPGVLPLVVRAGGGSVRDTLSLLDQLIAGSEGDSIEYERAVALLGYTHSALLDEVVDAIGARDAAAAFSTVDRVIQTGQDPRRFVEDLLERLRDLVVVGAFRDVSSGGAAAVLRGIQEDELERMSAQAARFGEAELSRTADVVGAALGEMTGATSPRLHLELMIARVLVPASDESERGTLARVERLERRVGVDGVSRGSSEGIAGASPEDARHTQTPARPSDDSSSLRSVEESQLGESAPVGVVAAPAADGDPGGPAGEGPEAASSPSPSAPVTFQQLSDAWEEILEVVGKRKRAAWAVAFTAKPMGLKDDVLALAFPSQNDVENFKKPQAAQESVSEILRQAIIDVLGIRVKFIARAVAGAQREDGAPPRTAEPADPPEPEPAGSGDPVVGPGSPPQTDADGWAIAPDTDTETEPESASASEPESASAPADRAAPAGPTEPMASGSSAPPSAPGAPGASAAAPASGRPARAPEAGGRQRYGEAVVRELLSANFIEEQQITPNVTPQREA
jgi:DNA polymerase-3 subunit gamma/tau